MYAIFTVYPIFRQFDISFFNWHIFPGASNPFVGWSNYTHIFHDPVVRTAAFNSLALRRDHGPGPDGYRAVRRGDPHRPAARLDALAGAHLHPGRHLVGRRQLHLRLHLQPAGRARRTAVSACSPATQCSIDWLAQTWTANGVIWLLGIWKGVGWSFIIFLAALDGVPREHLEAARVDGASEPRVWRHVIIPSIRPSIALRPRAARHRRARRCSTQST